MSRTKTAALLLLLSIFLNACALPEIILQEEQIQGYDWGAGGETVLETETIRLPENEDEASQLEVHFLDVGQGDATLIVSDGQTMLIDCGDDGQGTALQLYLTKQGIEKLDYLVLTHTDADHIGGADVIISKFEIGNVFIGDYKKETRVYRDLMQALKDRNLSYTTPAVGESFSLGAASFTILAPNKEYSDPNNTSIVLLLKNGENSFLFSGDAQEQAEKDILENGISIDCDVFKVGHHGSKHSNSKDFLSAMAPDWAVISCGENNSYGHPDAEVLNNLRSMGVKVYRTDEQGTIVAVSDGRQITWSCAPSETWQAGERRGKASE